MQTEFQKIENFLSDYGFVPWQWGKMQGWYRRTDFVKDCIAGEIGRYSADDYIVVKHCGKDSQKWLEKHCKAKEDVIKQRFLFLNSEFSEEYIKSYWFGIKGWLEILHYRKGDKSKKFADLIYLAEKLS